MTDVTFRHSGWQPTRNRVWTALHTAGVPEARREAFRTCGSHAWVLESRSDPGHYKIACNRCHDRFCLPCANERSALIAANVRNAIPDRPVRFITLTLRAFDEPLPVTCDRLTRSFAILRTRKIWKSHVTGGVAFLELKRPATRDRWHAHLHVIAEGTYIPKDRLSKAWRSITRDSFIVDIRLVRHPAQVTRYVTKYASKPLDPSLTRDPQDLVDAILALHRRRLCTTFGTWRGIDLLAHIDDGEWDPIGPLHAFLERAQNGDHTAATILDTLRRPNKCPARDPPQLTFSFVTTPGTEPFA